MKMISAALLLLPGILQGQLPAGLQQQLPAAQIEQQAQPLGLNTPFSINFRDASLVAVLNTLAQYGGLNLAITADVMGTVTQDLTNVTLLQALDVLLPPRGLTYTIENGLLRVQKLQMESRTFKFDYITTTRSLSRSISASSSATTSASSTGTPGAASGASVAGGGGGGGGSSSSVTGQETANLLSEIKTALNSLKSGEGKVVFTDMAGIIFATDYPRNLDEIGFYLETIQTAVHRQVIIEAKVLEISLDDTSQFGVNWTALFGNSLKIEQPFTGIRGFQITGTLKNATAVIDALAMQGKVNVLSNPMISALNNQPAIMRVGTSDVFFTTTTQVDPRTGIIVQSATTPATINEGIVLDVTPQISDDGIIMMNVHPTITERTGQVTSPQGSTVPIVDVRETDTVVRVREGGTVVIGGLISDRTIQTTNKVPVIGNLPLVGNLFRSTTKETKKTDLVILLTPRILDIQSAADYAKSQVENLERLKAETK